MIQIILGKNKMAMNKSQIQIMKNLKDFLSKFNIEYKEKNDIIYIRNCKPYCIINTSSSKFEEFVHREIKIRITRLYDNEVIIEISKGEKREKIFLSKDLNVVYAGKSLIFTF